MKTDSDSRNEMWNPAGSIKEEVQANNKSDVWKGFGKRGRFDYGVDGEKGVGVHQSITLADLKEGGVQYLLTKGWMAQWKDDISNATGQKSRVLKIIVYSYSHIISRVCTNDFRGPKIKNRPYLTCRPFSKFLKATNSGLLSNTYVFLSEFQSFHYEIILFRYFRVQWFLLNYRVNPLNLCEKIHTRMIKLYKKWSLVFW